MGLLYILRFIIFSNSLQDITRKINYDLRHIFEWLRANKISLNSGLILFRSKNKKNPKIINYGCEIWGQKQNKIVEVIERTQNKALRILNFKGPQELVDNLYKDSKINKLKSIIIKANCRFVYDQLKNNLPETFSNFFTLNTNFFTLIYLSIVKTASCFYNSITLKAKKQWNEVQNFIKIDIHSPKMTCSKFLKSLENYIKNEQ